MFLHAAPDSKINYNIYSTVFFRSPIFSHQEFAPCCDGLLVSLAERTMSLFQREHCYYFNCFIQSWRSRKARPFFSPPLTYVHMIKAKSSETRGQNYVPVGIWTGAELKAGTDPSTILTSSSTLLGQLNRKPVSTSSGRVATGTLAPYLAAGGPAPLLERSMFSLVATLNLKHYHFLT